MNTRDILSDKQRRSPERGKHPTATRRSQTAVGWWRAKLISPSSQEGFTTLIFMTLLLMLLLLGISAISTSSTDIKIAGNELNKNHAFNAADGAISRAIAQLGHNPKWRLGYQREVLGDGTYNLWVTDSTMVAALGDNLQLRSVGKCRGSMTEIKASAEPIYKPLWGIGMFGRDSVYVSGGSVMDSYSSDDGDYASQATNGPDDQGNYYANSNGGIGSNGTVDLAQVVVHGDVSSSETGDILFNGNAEVTGDTTTALPEADLDPVSQDDIDYAMTNNSAETSITFSGNAAYNTADQSLVLKPHSEAVLETGIYYFSSVNIEQATLKLAPGASVKIYVTGDWYASASSFVNDGTAGDFQVYSTGDNFTVTGTAGMTAAVYAPDANVYLNGNGDFYGSFVGNEVEVTGGANVHYDEALGKYKSHQIGSYYLASWEQTK